MAEKTNEYYLSLFKEKIVQLICSDEVAVKLINPVRNKYLDLEDVLLGGTFNVDGQIIKEQGYIFDYKYVSETVVDEKTFICVEAFPISYTYPLIDVILYVHIYVHKGVMVLTSKESANPSSPTRNEMYELGYIGNRCDQLTQVIGRLLNGSNKIGGVTDIHPYERGYITLDVPNYNFYGKCMSFKVKISDVGELDCS